jgi:hypothetical protein
VSVRLTESSLEMTFTLCYDCCCLRFEPIRISVASAYSMIDSLQKDRERAVYGLKEQNLAKTYVKLLGLQQNDPDSLRLLHWKAPSAGEVSGSTHLWIPFGSK